MADYRVYRLTADDTIFDGQWIVYESDSDAVLAATSLINGRSAVEIWAGTRKVAHLTAKELRAPWQCKAIEGSAGAVG